MINMPLFSKGDIVKLHPVDNKELDEDTIYVVYEVKNEVASIYKKTDNFNRVTTQRWDVSIHDLIPFKWEIKDDGDIWRFYYNGNSVSNLHKGSTDNQIKLDLFNQELARSIFGYMVCDEVINRCKTCKKNYRRSQSTSSWEYGYCSEDCENDNEFNI